MSELFSSITIEYLTMEDFLLATLASIILGAMIAFVYSRHEKCNQSFIVAITLLPSVVQTVIMIVNGNIGMGVAVAGAFSLIRFRSIPGNAKDIVIVFMAMATGLACGTGFIGIAILFTIILSLVLFLVGHFKIGVPNETEKELRITIPESLDYSAVFDDLFHVYTKENELISVKTTSLGSLYKLSYRVVLVLPEKEKEFIDQLRCRNGNLEISLSRAVVQSGML